MLAWKCSGPIEAAAIEQPDEEVADGHSEFDVFAAAEGLFRGLRLAAGPAQ
jgi:hypothetical protein